MRKIALVFALMGVTISLAEQNPQARVAGLEKALLAPCCYSGPIATHDSEVARQMKAEIRTWVAEGKTDREILDTYIQRYGKRVLVEPEGAAWWWMHVIPWVFLTAGLGLLLLILRRMRAARNAPAVPVATGPLPEFEDEEETYGAHG